MSLSTTVLLPSEPLSGESEFLQPPYSPGMCAHGTMGQSLPLSERARQQQAHATIRLLRLERRGLMDDIQRHTHDASSSAAATAGAQQLGPRTHELSPLSAHVHRTDRISSMHATALLHFAVARRHLFEGSGAPSADAAAGIVQTALDTFVTDLPRDATADVRAEFLLAALEELRRLHQRWAKAEIAVIDSVTAATTSRFTQPE